MVTASHGMYFYAIPYAPSASNPVVLWRCQGTDATTATVPGVSPTSVITGLVSFNDNILMGNITSIVYYNPSVGVQLLVNFCTVLLAYCTTGPSNFQIVGSTHFFFTAYDSIDNSIWRSDMTTAGTTKFCNAYPCLAANALNQVPFGTSVSQFFHFLFFFFLFVSLIWFFFLLPSSCFSTLMLPRCQPCIR